MYNEAKNATHTKGERTPLGETYPSIYVIHT